MARALVEACVNEVMSAQADAMCEETGTSRNGFRERRLETQVGAITLGIPKLREGAYFPEGIVERWSRVDRAVICAASEMFALGVSTRKVGKVPEKMGAARLSKDRVSRICFELDAEVSELRGRDLSGQRFPYLWVDATYVPCRRGGHGATAAVVTAVAVGEDGIRRVVGLACVDSESYASWKGFLRGLPARASRARPRRSAVRGLRRARRHRARCARGLPRRRMAALRRPSGARRCLGDPHAGR